MTTDTGAGPKLFDPRFLDELSAKLSASLPPAFRAFKSDVEQNFKAVLQSGLARLDLVSRQEFDVQAGVLARTREKLEALEQRLATLEAAERGTPAP